MTACYAKDRRDAIDELGDEYSCVCHPEIMNAFVYALNDSDERVRAKAADELVTSSARITAAAALA